VQVVLAIEARGSLAATVHLQVWEKEDGALPESATGSALAGRLGRGFGAGVCTDPAAWWTLIGTVRSTEGSRAGGAIW
jgi:hypothetical protein